MLKLISKLSLIIFSSIVIILGMLLFATKGLGDVYQNSYQSVFITKYNNLFRQNRKPSIILLGGSSLSFGIDQYLMEENTGMPIINMGLHAGFMPLFTTEIVKDGIIEGDIVILAFEYVHYEDKNAFTTIEPKLVMTAIDSHPSIYKHLPVSTYGTILSNLIPFTTEKSLKKSIPTCQDYGYSKCMFDDFGQMTFYRENSLLPSFITAHTGSIKAPKLSNEAKSYLLKYIQYMESKGVTVLISAAPISQFGLGSNSLEDIQVFFDELGKELGIPVISSAKDYFFSDEYFYDTAYHLTTQGSILRTERLAKDINTYIQNEGRDAR